MNFTGQRWAHIDTAAERGAHAHNAAQVVVDAVGGLQTGVQTQEVQAIATVKRAVRDRQRLPPGQRVTDQAQAFGLGIDRHGLPYSAGLASGAAFALAISSSSSFD